MTKIKFVSLEIYSDDGDYEGCTPQHVFVNLNGIGVSICKDSIKGINEDSKYASFDSLQDESRDDSKCCSECNEILKKLKEGDTEIQRGYKSAVSEIIEYDKEINELEAKLKDLKFKKIKANSIKDKAINEAKRLGVYSFLKV